MPDDALASFAGGTAQGLITFLIESIQQEVNLLNEASKEIDKISKELMIVRSFLEGATRRSEAWDATRDWKLQVRNTAYEAEDVMDEFVYYKTSFPPVRFLGFRKLIHPVKTVPEYHRIASRSKDVLSKFKHISERARGYGLQMIEASLHSRPSSSHAQLRSERSFFPGNVDRSLVGFDRERDSLVSWLRDEGPLRMVIAVKGMGGLGKTTLVYSTYRLLKSHFDCCAWITVSQSYSPTELLQRLIGQFIGRGSDHDRRNDDFTLSEELYNHLKHKKYLIVLDDVWDESVWRGLRYALPNNEKGSRVIVTTRKEEVASSLGIQQCRNFRLQPLGPQHAWDLFRKEAFVNGVCPLELETSAKAIVGRCGGLPLAIVAMAGLMASAAHSHTVEEWKSVEHRLGWYLSNNHRCESILSLSFNELPYRLKHCFLYLSIFPEDYGIKKRKLIRLWIAEGFVEEHSGWSLEDKAEDYLKELVNRNLVQVSIGSSNSYRMHDVMRELALQIAKEEKFLMVDDGQEARPCCGARRLSIQSTNARISLGYTGEFHLHSILKFGSRINVMFPMKRVRSHAKFLRVLDLEGARIDNIMDGLDELFNLRYLSLKNTRIAHLPKGCGKLLNLQIVDLRGTDIKKLPCKISSLQKLRHLYFGPPALISPGIPAPEGVSKLENLQTLAHIRADDSIVQKLERLTQLRKLGVTSVKEVHAAKLCSSIKKMDKLNNLSLMAVMGETLKLEHLSPPPPNIHKLVLVGKLNYRLHNWVSLLDCLAHLSLRCSRLTEDPLPVLQDLPSLKELELRQAFLGNYLLFRTGSFPKLKKLQLWDLQNLQRIYIERGAMPSIREMQFLKCKKMKERPRGVEYLPNLEIYASDMPSEFAA